MAFFETSGMWSVALGKTLLHSLWIGILILSLLRLILQSVPGHLSRARYRIATISMLLFPAAMVALFSLLYDATPALQVGFSTPLEARGTGSVLRDIQSFRAIAQTSTLFTLISYFYLGGIVVMMIRAVFSLQNLLEMKSGGSVITGEWADRFIRIKERIGIGRRVALLMSEKVTIPSLTGILKPAIIVPAGMFTHLSNAQVETILMHELFHLRRFDFLVNMIQVVVESLFFYNPALRSISRMIRTEREHCCDDLVVDTSEDPMDYAKALFQLAQHDRHYNILVPGAAGTDHNQLFQRIKRILKHNTMKANIRERMLTLALMVTGVIIMLAVSGFSSGLSITNQVDSRSELRPGNSIPVPERPIVNGMVPDTIPVKKPEITGNDREEAQVLMDWEEIMKEVEEARKEAMEDIDWDKMKQEVEEARKEAMEDIDWDKMKQEVEEARKEAMEDIDWDGLKHEMEESFREMKEMDWEKIREDVQKSMDEIDWEEIKIEMKNVKLHLDSMLQDFDFDMHLDHEPGNG